MTPIELQRKWELSNSQLAAALGKSEKTIEAYKAAPNKRSHRNVPTGVQILCTSLNMVWETKGKAEIFLCL
jgi:hypothetical protein